MVKEFFIMVKEKRLPWRNNGEKAPGTKKKGLLFVRRRFLTRVRLTSPSKKYFQAVQGSLPTFSFNFFKTLLKDFSTSVPSTEKVYETTTLNVVFKAFSPKQLFLNCFFLWRRGAFFTMVSVFSPRWVPFFIMVKDSFIMVKNFSSWY